MTAFLPVFQLQKLFKLSVLLMNLISFILQKSLFTWVQAFFSLLYFYIQITYSLRRAEKNKMPLGGFSLVWIFIFCLKRQENLTALKRCKKAFELQSICIYLGLLWVNKLGPLLHLPVLKSTIALTGIKALIILPCYALLYFSYLWHYRASYQIPSKICEHIRQCLLF